MAATTTDDLSLWLILFLLVMFVYSDNMPSFFVWAGFTLAFLVGIVIIIDKLCPECNTAIGTWIISHLRGLFSRQERFDVESQLEEDIRL